MKIESSRWKQPRPLPRTGAAIVLTATALFVWQLVGGPTLGQEKARDAAKMAPGADERLFKDFVQPLVTKHCLRCHNAEQMESGIRLDRLSAAPDNTQLFLWKDILKQVGNGAMPPPEEPQPSAKDRQKLTDWIGRTMNAAMARNTARNGSIRRLTVAQYRNTLRELLKLEENLTEVLPPDGMSKDGFANNGHSMVLSPLQVESYFDIAEKSLDLCLVDEKTPPVIQSFRMDLGRKINPAPCKDNLVLGALNALLDNADFQVSEPPVQKPFAYRPFSMQKKFRFIEGYVGNDTIREWRDFDSIYHAVFACVRGTMGYPKGEAVQTVPEGLLLRPAIPSSEIFGAESTYGPMANFKISLRELPDQGNFRITIQAARYDDGLLLEPGKAAEKSAKSIQVGGLEKPTPQTLDIPEAGIYQIDVARTAGKVKGSFTLQLDEREFTGALPEWKTVPSGKADAESTHGFLVVRLGAGKHQATAKYGNNATLRTLRLTRLDEASELGRRFTAFEKRSPSLGVHIGLRRDCGSTLARVGTPQAVESGALREYVYTGPINDFPSPLVEKDNVNYLAGIREIGVRSEFTDGRDMPRLLIRSIQFEGPYLTQWPPASHRGIFIDSPHANDPPKYAQEILKSFATRAFRRRVTDEELEAFVKLWENSYRAKKDFRASIKNALLAMLTSAQFLFLIEDSAGPQAEELTGWELASKLSYFLWNEPPDERLLQLASSHRLHASLEGEVDRLVADRRLEQAMEEFASQWLSLDKFDVVAVDEKRFPTLNRHVRVHLRQEPVQFLQYLMRNNLPLRNLVQSDFIVANEAVASYYGLAQASESGWKFGPIRHGNDRLGGLLSQAAILAGLSDGREANPVKRGAWFARKIVAEPPDDPPPNVPKLPEDDGHHLTLRQKLERHRNQPGCVKCHTGIDPWGLPFEEYTAAGLFHKDGKIDARSKLPDGAEVSGLKELKSHLILKRLDQVAFSFLKHLATYATGRSLSYNEIVFLKEQSARMRSQDYPMRDLIKFIVKSDLFLKK